MAAGTANILVEIGANLNYLVQLQTAVGVPMDLRGYSAKLVVRATPTASSALLTLDSVAIGGIVLGNSAFTGTTSGATLTLTTNATGTFALGQTLAGSSLTNQTYTIQSLTSGTLGQSGSVYTLSGAPGNVTGQPLTGYNGQISVAATAAQTSAITALLSTLNQVQQTAMVGLDALGNSLNATGYPAFWALEITDGSGNVTRVLQGTAIISPEVVR